MSSTRPQASADPTMKSCYGCCGRLDVLSGVLVAAGITVLLAVVHFILLVLQLSHKHGNDFFDIDGPKTGLAILLLIPIFISMLVFEGVRRIKFQLLIPVAVFSIISMMFSAGLVFAIVRSLFLLSPHEPDNMIVRHLIGFVLFVTDVIIFAWFYRISYDAMEALWLLKNGSSEICEDQHREPRGRSRRAPKPTAEERRLTEEVALLRNELNARALPMAYTHNYSGVITYSSAPQARPYYEPARRQITPPPVYDACGRAYYHS